MQKNYKRITNKDTKTILKCSRMENRINNIQVLLWIGFTCLLAVTLAVNGVQALFGNAKFAYWHIPSLFVGMLFSWESMTAPQRAKFLAFIRLSRIKAARHSRTISAKAHRAVRGLAALFTFPPFNRPQTEP